MNISFSSEQFQTDYTTIQQLSCSSYELCHRNVIDHFDEGDAKEIKTGTQKKDKQLKPKRMEAYVKLEEKSKEAVTVNDLKRFRMLHTSY